jgi:RNA polymerase sigma-70 factor (ECF subfamily)
MPVSLQYSSDTSHWAFTTTHWSVVLAAKEQGSKEADAAMDRLCRYYRRPIYAFILREGYKVHDAEDLTQGFFARLLKDEFLSAVDRSKGKFRNYLLKRLKNFLKNQSRRPKAQKRGGNATHVSMDAASDQEEGLQVAASNPTPDEVFLQQWARTLLESTLEQLRAKYHADGKGAMFDELKVYLTLNDDDNGAGYAELAKKLGKTEAALKMAKLRLKKEWRELLRGEIAKTVTSLEEVDDELRALFEAFSSQHQVSV